MLCVFLCVGVLLLSLSQNIQWFLQEKVEQVSAETIRKLWYHIHAHPGNSRPVQSRNGAFFLFAHTALRTVHVAAYTLLVHTRCCCCCCCCCCCWLLAASCWLAACRLRCAVGADRM